MAEERAAAIAKFLGLHNGDIPARYAKEIERYFCSAIEQAAAEEREACAKLCFKRMPETGFEEAHTNPGLAYELGRIDQAQSDAAAIRARSS